MGKIRSHIETNKTKDLKLQAFCSRCERETNHLVLQSVDSSGSKVIGYFENTEETIDWRDNYQIIQCQGCDTVSFRHANWCSEAIDDDSDGTSARLYPKRSNNTLPLKDFLNVPTNLRRIYRETIACFNNDASTLCASGLRAIVEGICADQNVSDGPVEVVRKDGTKKTQRKKELQAKIAGLWEKGILTRQHSDVLHEHRYLGNEAVHELAQPSPDELRLAIEIIEHTLETLYEIPEKAEELRKKKFRRMKKSTT